jgi:hypothetical protein
MEITVEELLSAVAACAGQAFVQQVMAEARAAKLAAELAALQPVAEPAPSSNGASHVHVVD